MFCLSRPHVVALTLTIFNTITLLFYNSRTLFKAPKDLLDYIKKLFSNLDYKANI